MADLTTTEKAAGRAFLAESEAAFCALPPARMPVPVYLHHIRHVCPKLGKSVSFELKEVRVESPEYSGAETVPAGRFAWVYREGRCPDCKITARSGSGRLTDAALRPPLGRS